MPLATTLLSAELLFFATLAGLAGCVVQEDHDEDGFDPGSGPPPGSFDRDTDVEDGADDPDGIGGEDDAEPTDDSAETGSDDPAGGPAAVECGWGFIGQDEFPEGYICGGDGPDPDGIHNGLCPADTALSEGGSCGSIGGVGCCDPDGNVWFCGFGNDGEPELFVESCGSGLPSWAGEDDGDPDSGGEGGNSGGSCAGFYGDCSDVPCCDGLSCTSSGSSWLCKDACGVCTSSCSGLPGCCTGTGCICEDVC